MFPIAYDDSVIASLPADFWTLPPEQQRALLPHPIPDWAQEPFRMYRHAWRDVVETYRIANQGMRLLVRRMAAREFGPARAARQSTRNIAHLEAIAGSERVLVSHGLIALWAVLEACIDDLAIAWLAHVPSVWDNTALQAIQGPLALFVAMTDEERAAFVLDQLKRPKGGKSDKDERRGIDRHEDLLTAVGLGGAVAKETKTALVELHQIRNVLAHRGGIVDQRFVRMCPWLDLAVGALLPLDGRWMERYDAAVFDYIQTVGMRVYRAFGCEIIQQGGMWVARPPAAS